MRSLSIILSLLATLAGASALAAPAPLERRIELPAGASMLIKSIDVRADSIVLSVTVANPGDAALHLNEARRLVLQEETGGAHRLNPPPDNPDLEIPPGAQLDGKLVFIGPPMPAARAVVLSNGAFREELPLTDNTAAASARQAGRNDGIAVRVNGVRIAGGRCFVALLATNGSDRTLVLNQGRSLVLIDTQGKSAPVEPPSGNRELVVPAGDRLDAQLGFDCRSLAKSGRLALSGAGRGGASPGFEIEAVAMPETDAAAPPRPRAAVQPIGWSVLLEAVPAATGPPADPTPRAPPPAPAAPDGDKIARLTDALHARKTERGLRLSLAAASLFGAGAALAPAADNTLGQLAGLIAAAEMHEVVITVHAGPAGRERARAIAAWLERHASRPAPRVIASAKDAPQPASASTGDSPPEQRPWVDVILRRDYLVPNKRSPASPSPGKM